MNQRPTTFPVGSTYKTNITYHKVYFINVKYFTEGITMTKYCRVNIVPKIAQSHGMTFTTNEQYESYY